MVPREILNYATPCRASHLLNDLRMPIQMLQCCCDGADISWFHDDSLNAIAHHIACLARRDLRQRARRRFICDFGASFPLRRKNMHRGLIEIILRVAYEPDDANVDRKSTRLNSSHVSESRMP